MRSGELLKYCAEMLCPLMPPFEAIAVGGSLGHGSLGHDSSDVESDVDMFLLVADDDFFSVVRDFPDLIRHPAPPVVERRRGFVPEFGYRFTYVYPGWESVDYVINCRSSLPRTPMVAKTVPLVDSTGYYTRFIAAESTARESDRPQADFAGDVVIELLRIRKYARRNELVSLEHRYERLRLAVLAMYWHLQSGRSYVPHDADKWVARDLGPDVVDRLLATFPSTDPVQAVSALRALHALIAEIVARAGTEAGWPDGFQSTVSQLTEQAIGEMSSG